MQPGSSGSLLRTFLAKVAFYLKIFIKNVDLLTNTFNIRWRSPTLYYADPVFSSTISFKNLAKREPEV
jgi:hypothetical protein